MLKEFSERGFKNTRNVPQYIFGEGTLAYLSVLIKSLNHLNGENVIYFLDEFFKNKLKIINQLPKNTEDEIIFVSTKVEPTTDYIDKIVNLLVGKEKSSPYIIIGMGGGVTMDVAKAVSNLLTNSGRAEDYQGWDLVKNPGIYKIAIPTLSGTGAEATRTCVMTNKKSGLKLGMNSDYTVFDQIIMDPDLTITVPKNQYFYTGMDAYIHCIESINGSYRNAIGDAYSAQTISICRDVFLSKNMMSDENRSKLMVASYLGGCAIATSYVGVIHPFSAGLSVVLGIHHCIANCITMRAMEEFYYDEYQEFWRMVEKQRIEIPKGICSDLSDEQYEKLYASTIVHEKPLINALGENFRDLLTKDKIIELFRKM
jgi:3-deoxy-alpha-D-manno-octulosonate 8-oxidase